MDPRFCDGFGGTLDGRGLHYLRPSRVARTTTAGLASGPAISFKREEPVRLRFSVCSPPRVHGAIGDAPASRSQ